MSTNAGRHAIAGMQPGPDMETAVDVAGRLFRALVARPLADLATHYRRQRAIAELRHYDDHLLRDLGIDRTEIASVVYGLGTDGSRRR